MMDGLSDVARDERTARIALSMLVEPNDPVTGRLVAHLGAVKTLWLAERDDAVVGLRPLNAQVWRDHLTRLDVQQLAGRIDQVQQLGFGVLIPGDRDWPAALNDLGDFAPYVLWTRGASSFLSRPLPDQVTITGARAATSYGEHVAGELAGAVARDERVVVAGGAYGIEGAAHRAVLAAGGDTIAVLPCGVDRLYPTGHSDLLERVADVGLLVSELPPGTTPTRHRFMARARIMAALSSATVIVEAAWRSGSLAVAHRAQELGRAVGAVPGPVTSATSVGTHGLLREGTASLVADSSDLAVLFGHNPDAGSSRSIAREPLDAAQIRDRQTDSSRTL